MAGPKTPPKRPIYLDNAASTPMDERVIAAMVACLGSSGTFGNSASKDHVYGWEAAEVVESARDAIASAVGCSPLELIFTSGATESNNLALRGLCLGLKAQALAQGRSPKLHLITTTVEHKAVLECCEQLEHEGFRVTYLKPRRDGTVTPEMLRAAEHLVKKETGADVQLSIDPERLSGAGVVLSSMDGKVSYNNQLDVRMRRYSRDIRRIVQEENARQNSR